MTLVAVLALMMVSFGAIAWPFFGRSGRDEGKPKAEQPWDDLVSQRDAAYQALKELEFEYNLGNLSDADYADLRDRYRSQAARILQRLDAASPQQCQEPKPVTVLSPDVPVRACPFCDETVEKGDTYCWRCGERLCERCHECGEPLLEEDKFCAGCGRSLEAQT